MKYLVGLNFREQLSWLSVVLFYAIVANVPYWAASHAFGFYKQLGIFCVEYAIVGAIACFVPRIVSAGILLIVILCDLLCSVCLSYSLPIRQCVDNVGGAVQGLTAERFVYATSILSLLLLTSAAAGSLRANALAFRFRLRAALCLSCFAATIVVIDLSAIYLSVHRATGDLPTLFGTRPVGDGSDPEFSGTPRLARVQSERLIRMVVLHRFVGAFEKHGKASDFPVPSATGAAVGPEGLMARQSSATLPNIVLVLVESWGLAGDLQLRNALVRPYLQPAVTNGYHVVQGDVAFHGSTVPGEARELCASGIGYYVTIAPRSDLGTCLPAQLVSAGYYNIALHGMNGLMFNRTSWWSRIGFQEMWFNEELKRQGMPDCIGAHRGTCDANIAGWIGHRLAQDNSKPLFVYWVTLNSHLPVPVPTTLADPAPCAASISLVPRTALCSWYQLVSKVHESVALAAMSKTSRPTVFIVVGDHTPPFSTQTLRDGFSQTEVPYVLLLPKAMAGDNSSYR
jgi:hypothetical protein